MNQIEIDRITGREVSQVCERCDAKLQSPKDDNMYDEDYHQVMERVCSKCLNRACLREDHLQTELAKERNWLEANGYGYVE